MINSETEEDSIPDFWNEFDISVRIAFWLTKYGWKKSPMKPKLSLFHRAEQLKRDRNDLIYNLENLSSSNWTNITQIDLSTLMILRSLSIISVPKQIILDSINEKLQEIDAKIEDLGVDIDN